MILATIIIPVGVVGLFAGCEYLMARHSKWDVLSQKFRNTSIPPNGWRGCRFLQLEILEGNRLKRTTYGHGGKSPLDADKLVGDVVELRRSDPNLRIDLPANTVGNLEQYVGAKTRAPVRQPWSLVGAV